MTESLSLKHKFYSSLRNLKSSLDTSNLAIDHDFFTFGHISEKERKKLYLWQKINKKRNLTFSIDYPELIKHFCYIKSKTYSLMHYPDNSNSIMHTLKAKSCSKIAAKSIRHQTLLELLCGKNKFLAIYARQEQIAAKKYTMFYSSFNKKVTDGLVLKKYLITKNGLWMHSFGFHYLVYLRIVSQLLDEMISTIELT